MSATFKDSGFAGQFGGSQGAGADARMEARRMAALNEQRQVQMVTEAQQLLQLAKRLKADVDAGGTILSQPQRLQMASEIEKLAKKVKDKMTYAIGGTNDIVGPFAAWRQ